MKYVNSKIEYDNLSIANSIRKLIMLGRQNTIMKKIILALNRVLQHKNNNVKSQIRIIVWKNISVTAGGGKNE